MSFRIRKAISELAPESLLILALGLILGGAAVPLVLEGARVMSERIAPIGSLSAAEVLARAISSHPVLTGIVLTLATGILLMIIGRHERGPKNVKWLWGLYTSTIPDNVQAVEEARRQAELDERRAIERVEDFAFVTGVISPLVDRPSYEGALQVLDRICEMGSRALSTGPTLQASIWVCDSAKTNLRIRGSYRVAPETIQKFLLKSGEGLAGQVFATQQPRVIPDIERVTPNDYVRDPHSANNPTTIMGLPLFSDSARQNVIGVICFSHGSSRDSDRFSADDLTRAAPYSLLASLTLSLTAVRGIDMGGESGSGPV